MQNTIFTIGHSTHSLNHFIELLNLYNVKGLCDVRSQPYSKYNSQFNKNILQKALLGVGIEYLFLGEELGGRSQKAVCYNYKGQLQYQLLAQEPLFKRGLDKVESEATKAHVALMCSEGEPLTCHRTILVCKELQKRPGLQNHIQHILFDGSVRSHTKIEKKLMDKLKIFPDMFRTEKECIEEAYKQQAQKIAYTYPKDSALLKESQAGVSPSL